MTEQAPEPEQMDYNIFFEHPPNLEAIRQAIRDMGQQERLEISYEELENKELI